MTFHTPNPSGRIIAPGGPVSGAIRAMREALDLPPLLLEQFERERGELDGLRAAIKRQIEADFDRIDRCLVVLDSLDGDDDLEPTLGFVGRGHIDEGEDGGDDEPSLCGITATYPSEGGSDRELDECDREEDDPLERTSLETRGAGFRPSGQEDDEDGCDAEACTDDNGIIDMLSASEQGFVRHYGHCQ